MIGRNPKRVILYIIKKKNLRFIVVPICGFRIIYNNIIKFFGYLVISRYLEPHVRRVSDGAHVGQKEAAGNEQLSYRILYMIVLFRLSIYLPNAISVSLFVSRVVFFPSPHVCRYKTTV